MPIFRVLSKLILVFILMVFPCSAAEETERPEVYFNSTSLRPGDFVLVRVQAENDAEVKVSFLENVRRLWKDDNGFFIGFLPVSYYNTPGEYQITVTVETYRTTWAKQYPLRIDKRQFPESRIWVPETKRKEILTDTNRDSDTKIVTAVREEAIQNGGFPLWEGTFCWPVKGPISTGFGKIRYVNNIDNGRHSGFDIISPAGTPVVAVNHGRVIFAGNLYLTGLTVIIYHGLDLFTSYAHLSSIAVKQGEQVRKGTVIGRVGSTGLSTGPHLHLTFRIGEVCVDPGLFLERKISWDFTDH